MRDGITYPFLYFNGWSMGAQKHLQARKSEKFSLLNKLHILQCMGKIFCVEFQRVPLKLHTKYRTETLKVTIVIQYEFGIALQNSE